MTNIRATTPIEKPYEIYQNVGLIGLLKLKTTEIRVYRAVSQELCEKWIIKQLKKDTGSSLGDFRIVKSGD